MVLRALLRLPVLLWALRGADVVVVQREFLPFGPPIVEALARFRRRMIWDVDDAVWEPYVSPTAGNVPRWLRATFRKFERLCSTADEVWAGSDVLASWCSQHSDSVVVVPTVVDVPKELPGHLLGRTVSWIGSHSTVGFLESVLPAVAEVSPPVTITVVGGEPRVPDGLQADVLPWSPEKERDALVQASVGLYPIDRKHPLAEGKCGLKAILFMSQGLPVVVTPTTTNSAVVRHEIDGLYADNPGDWTNAIERLLADADLWERLRRSAHERVLAAYSLDAWAPRVADQLWRLVLGPAVDRPAERVG